jgi:hypothetical protein
VIPDGGMPDRHWHLLEPGSPWPRALELRASGPGLDGPADSPDPVSDTSFARMRRICLALHEVHGELLRAHASTVVALARLSPDRNRLSRALAEARGEHEALFLVRSAVEALAGAVDRLRG